MSSKREDYSYLLDEMSLIYENARYKEGKLIDKDGNYVSDDIDKKYDFYLLYMDAYSEKDDSFVKATVAEDYEPFFIAKSYDMFNFLVNTLLKEYQVYGDINTGNVNYYPYKELAEYLINGNHIVEETIEERKRTIINFLESTFNLKDCKRRVKTK